MRGHTGEDIPERSMKAAARFCSSTAASAGGNLGPAESFEKKQIPSRPMVVFPPA
jgi:hypothetical protein